MAHSRYGTNALWCACNAGLGDVASTLIARGADIGVVCSWDGTNALHWACYHKGLGAVAFTLVEQGSRVDAVDSYNGTNALHWAHHHKLTALASALAGRGASIDGLTPIMAGLPAQELRALARSAPQSLVGRRVEVDYCGGRLLKGVIRAVASVGTGASGAAWATVAFDDGATGRYDLCGVYGSRICRLL